MITCRELIEFLLEYRNGELTPQQRAVFDEHLAVCPPCVAYLDTYEKTIEMTKAAYSCPDHGEVPEELVQAILAALQTDSSSSAQ